MTQLNRLLFLNLAVLVVLSMVGPIKAVGWQQQTPPALSHLGLNKFDLALQYLGFVSGGTGEREYKIVTQAMALKSLVDAKSAGATFLRISATGYGPVTTDGVGDLSLWKTDPAAYWTSIDLMIEDLERVGIKIAPVFFWNWTQFAALNGGPETVTDLVSKPNSKSYLLFSRYIREFIGRYKSKNIIEFYELTNEMNLGADLDLAGRCKRENGWGCNIQGNFSTEMMIGFLNRTAQLIRSLDPGKKISSGLALPRGSAEHLRARPEWHSSGADWGGDSEIQFRKNLAEINSCCEIVSIHFYWNEEGDRNRFGYRDGALLNRINSHVLSLGKELFIGEYGGKASNDEVMGYVFNSILQSRVAYSAPWVFEFYQSSLFEVLDFHIEPGYSDKFLGLMKGAATAQMNAYGIKGKQPALFGLPQVVLTWPLSGSKLQPKQLIYSVASAANGIKTLELWIDDTKAAVLGPRPPYQISLDTTRLSVGPHKIEVKIQDNLGNQNSYIESVSK